MDFVSITSSGQNKSIFDLESRFTNNNFFYSKMSELYFAKSEVNMKNMLDYL